MPFFAVYGRGVFASLEELECEGLTGDDAAEFDDFFEAEEYSLNGGGSSRSTAGDFWVVCANGDSKIFTTKEECDVFVRRITQNGGHVEQGYFTRLTEAELFASCATGTLEDIKDDKRRRNSDIPQFPSLERPGSPCLNGPDSLTCDNRDVESSTIPSLAKVGDGRDAAVNMDASPAQIKGIPSEAFSDCLAAQDKRKNLASRWKRLQGNGAYSASGSVRHNAESMVIRAEPVRRRDNESSTEVTSADIDKSLSINAGQEEQSGEANPPLQHGMLDERQRAAVNLAHAGHSFFLTGCAGTGKSFVLKKIVEELRGKGLVVHVTASTGMAAIAVGGSTIHSFSGVGDGLADVNCLCRKAATRMSIRRNWMSCQVLIIDEISMIDSFLFDKIETIARFVRGIDEPFGGVQIIACGDYFQLPPVRASDANAQETQERHFAFESNAWRRTIKCGLELNFIHRQSNRGFVQMLDEVRHGEMSSNTISELSGRVVSGAHNGGSDSSRPRTKLYALKKEVRSINNACLNSLSCPGVTYVAKDSFANEEGRRLLYRSNMPCEQELCLKVGATVICVKNVDPVTGLVNGSIGEVVAFGEEGSVLKLKDGETATHIIQKSNMSENPSDEHSKPAFPQELSKRESEVSVKRPSTQSSDRDFVQLKEKNILGNVVENFSHRSVQQQESRQVEPRGVQESKYDASDRDAIYPWVRFGCGTFLMKPTDFPVSSSLGHTIANRRAIPLALGWALTIHKSQGMTIDRLETSLGNAFDFGMAYVALSRLKSLDGLRLMSFDPARVETHPKVKAYAQGNSGAFAKVEQLLTTPVCVMDPLPMPEIRETHRAARSRSPKRRFTEVQ